MRMLLDLIGRIFGYLNNKANDTDVVHNTNDETIVGVKTFSASPIVPDPTTNTQAANKKSVDLVSSRLNGLNFIQMTNTEYEALETKDANTIYFLTSE